MASDNACDSIQETIAMLTQEHGPKHPAITHLTNVYRMLCGKDPIPGTKG